MKKYLLAIGICVVMILTLLPYQPDAATITKGYTFTTNEQVTSTKLHLLVDGATLSSITSSDITDGTIALSDMGANSVDSSKIVDASVASADIATRGIATSNVATNAITQIELNTNIFFRTGFLSFSNSTLLHSANQISSTAINGATNSTGVGSAGLVVKLNDSGVLDSSFSPFSGVFTSTNLVMANAGLLTVTHGLGAAPSLVQGRIICVSGEANYSVNDEVLVSLAHSDAGSSEGFSTTVTSTTILVRVSSGGFEILDKTTGSRTTATTANWKLIVRAWK